MNFFLIKGQHNISQTSAAKKAPFLLKDPENASSVKYTVHTRACTLRCTRIMHTYAGPFRLHAIFWSRQGRDKPLQVLETQCDAGNGSVACEDINYYNILIDEGREHYYYKWGTRRLRL